MKTGTGKWYTEKGGAWEHFERLFGPVPVVRDPESWQAVADAGRKYA